MSATVAAALKKIAVSILTNPKILKKVLCIVLVLVIALATPLLAVYAALTGKVEIDIDGIAENYVENLDDAQVRELQKMNDTMLAVESALNDAEPVIKYFDGWKCDISGIRNWEDLPKEAKEYVAFIEYEIGCPITYVSVGPERDSIIIRK